MILTLERFYGLNCKNQVGLTIEITELKNEARMIH